MSDCYNNHALNVYTVPEDIFFILCFPGALKSRVLRPHGEGDPSVVEYFLTHRGATRGLGLYVGLRKGSITGSMSLQALVICVRACEV